MLSNNLEAWFFSFESGFLVPYFDILPGWATVLSAIFGGLVAGVPMLIAQWSKARREEKRSKETTAKLEQLTDMLDASPEFREVKAKQAQDYERFAAADVVHERHETAIKELGRVDCALQEEVRLVHLAVLRQDLFSVTRDRGKHEQQLESGREYLRLRGNGSGHVRLNQLQKDYERRLAEDDWVYPHGEVEGK